MVLEVTIADVTDGSNVRGTAEYCPTRRALLRLGVTRRGELCSRVTLDGIEGGLIWFGNLDTLNVVLLHPHATEAERRWDQGIDEPFQFIIDDEEITL